ncbi:Type I restriction-modification system, specificity subunit S [Thioalkalivibrio nitratireducens DSM 14787]|uniref:Type I restriction-modification system, specificity subunit S n=1 Tax=Thioalkalivibrio nitratireducens (strain DSM 14787 / UNIQEM 213 / ALEN2) TaxID=1255043 RepID=L0DSZ1_THIND|nr:restriction endonuclease subunit S [Thioalkalivibrio nitratireducens]AGA32729.1 Type I restriction-modification system, specificity subunit S [Thioalkalivibrio nitratireducens DSM 14787]
MTFPRYPRYKDSGVEWLGEVPAHWEVKRLRYVAQLNPSKSEIRSLPAETPVSFIPMESVGDDGSLVLDQTRALQDVIDGYTYVREGDVAVAKITPCFENGKAAIMRGLTNGVGLGTTELTVLRPRGPVTTSTYLFRVVTSEPFRWLGESHMYGAGGQKRVPDDFLREFAIAWPPRDEQDEIAAFLDHETGKIDALIEEQRRLIELLKEKRLAVISHAVTKGLDPNVPMKDSGVEWLGEVPAHWRVGKIKWHFFTTSGGTPSSSRYEEYFGGDIPWLRSLDLNDGVIAEYKVSVTEKALIETSCRVVPKGSVLIAMYGGDGTIGKNGLLGFDAAINQALCAFLPSKKHLASYLHRYLQFYRPYWMVGAESSRKDPNIGQDRIGDSFCLLPPVEEQGEIASYLHRVLADLDRLETDVVELIGALEERRSALISAAVTGKIDVRGWLAGLETQEPELAMAAEEPAGYSAQGGAA